MTVRVLTDPCPMGIARIAPCSGAGPVAGTRPHLDRRARLVAECEILTCAANPHAADLSRPVHQAAVHQARSNLIAEPDATGA